jgi:signal transduction histidine kinase
MLRICLKLLLATALFVAGGTGAAFASAGPPDRVLLVYQDDGDIPANMAFEASLAGSLRASSGLNLQFYREQLDSGRLPAFKEQRLAELRSRYANLDIDIVVYFGNTLTEILPNVPTIQVSNWPPETRTHPNVVYVSFYIDARKIVEVARRFQPNVGKVLLISGTSDLDRVYLTQFEDRLRGEPGLSVETISNASLAELTAMVSHLPRETVVMPISYSRDPSGNSYLPRDIVARLASVSTAPVYAVSDTYVGVGSIGGYVVSWEKTGRMAADAATQILSGKPPAEVHEDSSGSGVYMFDWRELKKWGFSKVELPPGTIVQYRVPTAWEQYRWRIVAGAVVIFAQSVLIVALLIYRQKRRRAEKSLREMTGRLLQSQDEERRRIARDLHDGTAQHLAGMALMIGQVLADFPPGYDVLRQQLQDSHVASREALNEVRTVSYVLHPPILDGLGLIPAIRWYLDGLRKRNPLHIEFDAPSELPNMEVDAERALFRIVQEALTNVIRHAGGTSVSVVLCDSGKNVTLEIKDDGRGMPDEDVEQVAGAISTGVGISGMRERVEQLRGKIEIGSTPRGTRVFVSIPRLKERNAAHSVGR